MSDTARLFSEEELEGKFIEKVFIPDTVKDLLALSSTATVECFILAASSR